MNSFSKGKTLFTVGASPFFIPRTKRFVRGANNDYPAVISRTILIVGCPANPGKARMLTGN